MAAAAARNVASLHNVGGWLTTVTSRICLDMLRADELSLRELGLVLLG